MFTYLLQLLKIVLAVWLCLAATADGAKLLRRRVVRKRPRQGLDNPRAGRQLIAVPAVAAAPAPLVQPALQVRFTV